MTTARALILLAILVLGITHLPARAAGNLDGDVFGTYLGTLRASGPFRYRAPVSLNVTRAITITVRYRIRGAAVRERYFLAPSGSLSGKASLGGRRATKITGTWRSSARTITASGTSRIRGGGASRFTARVRFGADSVRTVFRSGRSLVRTSGLQ